MDKRLWAAASRGDLAEVTRLIEVEHVDIDGPPAPHMTALMAAISGNHYEILDFLINHGANVEIVRSDQTALTRAVLFKRQRMVQRLIEAGASVNPPTRMSPLQISLEYNILPITEMLIKAGALPPKETLDLDMSSAELLQMLIPGTPRQESQTTKQYDLHRMLGMFPRSASAAIIGERAWARRAAAVKAWAAAHPETYENENQNGGRRRKSRRSRGRRVSRKATKKSYRRRH